MPLEREWVSVTDPDDDHLRYTFDVTFLLSSYTCIYGAGCRGVRTDRVDEVVGCCVHGAYLNEDDDPAALEALVSDRLDPDTMFHHAEAVAGGVLEVDDEGETKTRTVDDGCIFLNPEGFAAGMGCALHHLADRDGVHHMTHKPVVCWQLPLHRAIEEQVANDGEELQVHTIGPFERGHWGGGGAEFLWYCTDQPSAYVGDHPVYRSMEHELREMVGDGVYEELVGYLDRRRRQSRPRMGFLPVVD
ncbi:MAG: hypothetical protein ACLGIR_07105 [Actinomycetes bacterium]